MSCQFLSDTPSFGRTVYKKGGKKSVCQREYVTRKEIDMAKDAVHSSLVSKFWSAYTALAATPGYEDAAQRIATKWCLIKRRRGEAVASSMCLAWWHMYIAEQKRKESKKIYVGPDYVNTRSVANPARLAEIAEVLAKARALLSSTEYKVFRCLVDEVNGNHNVKQPLFHRVRAKLCMTRSHLNWAMDNIRRKFAF